MAETFRGNRIIYKNGKWFYEKTQLPVADNYKEMPCGSCGKIATPEGHDACLSELPGLMNACCGHGNINEAYVQFLDGECIRGGDAMNIIKILKKYKEQ